MEEGVVLMGDSAGGGLSLALMVYIKDYINTGGFEYVKMPISGVLFSPWVDLSCSSASWSPVINQDYLPSFPPLGYFYDLFDGEKGNPVSYSKKLIKSNRSCGIQLEMMAILTVA